jgi:hypothetical protein
MNKNLLQRIYFIYYFILDMKIFSKKILNSCNKNVSNFNTRRYLLNYLEKGFARNFKFDS